MKKKLHNIVNYIKLKVNILDKNYLILKENENK